MAKLHLIANAHIDAAWLWRWQESYSEVLATFRSALDRLNEFPDLKFTSGSSVYYKWVEETDPQMFEEIKEMVKSGRWSIVGGWYLQPDCNLPDGESFARHSLIGQRYFKEKLGVIAKTGYNVDPFGHCSAIPKILKNGGMDNYVFWRPSPEESDFKETLFNFRSDDGSGVKAFRLPIAYRIDLNCMENFAEIKRMAEEENMDYMLFCGVGNHGGGPTIQLLDAISKLGIEDMGYSTVDEYFADVDIYELPVICNELQHNARGCYSANTMIKNINRRSENNLVMAETICLMANKLVDFSYPKEGLRKGWENTLFNQFHDILCGCSIKEVYSDAQYMFGETMNICEQGMNAAMQKIAWNIDTLNGEKLPSYKIDDKRQGRWAMWLHEVLGTPIVVFNPYPWNVKHSVSVNGAASKMTDCDNNEIPFQHIRGLHKNFEDVCHTVFTAEVPSMGYAVYRFFTEQKSEAVFGNEIVVSDYIIENSKIKVEFSPDTGEISKLYDKEKDVYIIDKPCCAILLDETKCNTWGHDVDELGEEVGVFSQPEFHIVEQGINMASVCITNKYNDVVLKRTYTITSGSACVDVQATIDIYEKHRTVKLAFPTNGNSVLAKVPFSVIEREQNKGEEPVGSWFACGRLCVINDSKYAYDTKNNEVRLTILRTTQFADHYCERDEYCEYMDIGTHKFSYAIMPYTSNSMAEREALIFNGGLKTVFGSFHKGSLPMKMSCMSISNDDVIVSAVKMHEDSNEAVIRLYEINGNSSSVDINIFGKSIHTNISNNEIKTLSENGDELNFMEWAK